jgi:peptidoglycan-N-acetylglucosamine deacetylase
MLFDKGARIAACMKTATMVVMATPFSVLCTPTRPAQKPIAKPNVRPAVAQAVRPLEHSPAKVVLEPARDLPIWPKITQFWSKSAMGSSSYSRYASEPMADFASKHEQFRPGKEIVSRFLAELQAIEPPVDCAVQACVALTFDDGPNVHTAALLDTLATHKAKATFFMLGSQAVKYPDTVRRVVKEGHEVGNHSWGHANFGPMQQDQIAADIAHAQQAFRDLGVSPRLMRPPYGIKTPAVHHATDMSLAYWNVDPKDWEAKDPHALAQTVIASAKSGGIVVLHDIKPITVAAAAEFVPALKQRFQLVTVSQLMSLTSSSPKSEIFGR